MRYSKSRNAGTGCLNLTLGARNVIWIFLFHFSFVSSASWLVLGGVMSTTHQVVITLSRIVFSCDGWLQQAVPISHIRIILLHEFFFISWVQDNLESIVCSMFTVPNVFGAWQHISNLSLSVKGESLSFLLILRLIHWLPLGKVMGMGTHHGLWVWVQVGVSVGTGFGYPHPYPYPHGGYSGANSPF